DAIYDSKNHQMTQLNSQDQILALKPGGAIGTAFSALAGGTAGQNNMYGNNAGSAITPIQSPNNYYAGVSKGYSGAYGGGGNNNVGGTITLNIQGTINLTGGGGSDSGTGKGAQKATTKISASELVNDRQFVRELTRIIGNQQVRDSNGGKYVGKLN